MSDTTPLEAETRFETTTFEYFGRTWTIPTKRHLTHLVRMRDEARRGWADANMIVAETMLGEKQFAELLELNPTEPDFDAFSEQIAKTLGVGSQGNS